MLRFFQSHLYLIFIPILLLIIGLFFLARRQKARREWEDMSQRKHRDKALNEALRNPRLRQNSNQPDRPLEISWTDKACKEKKIKPASPMAELVLLSEYSHRKYVYRLDQSIRIGSGTDNHMELHWDGVAPQHCEIFLNQQKPCVRSLSGAETWLKRGKASAPVGADGVYLHSGDHIRLGTAEISFRVLKG